MLAVALGSFSLVIFDDHFDGGDGARGGKHLKFHMAPGGGDDDDGEDDDDDHHHYQNIFAQLLLLLSLATPRWLWISTIEAIPPRFGTDHFPLSKIG